METWIYILAGGKSSRMGQDKGLLVHDGKSLIQHVIDTVRPLGFCIKLQGASSSYDHLGLDSIPDLFPGLGPAGGILSALADAGNGRVLVLPCDMPKVKTSWLRILIEKSVDWDVLISESTSGIEPLCGVYSYSIKDQWEHQVRSGKLKLTDLIGQFRNDTLRIMDFPEQDPDMFANINTPIDMEKLNAKPVLQVLAFGKLAELLGSRLVEIPAYDTVRGVKDHFLSTHPAIGEITFSVAVNQSIVTDDHRIQPGSEVALLPPFSGG